MNILWKRHLWWMLFIVYASFEVVMGCSNKKSEQIPKTSNELFNRLVQEAPATRIELDKIPVDTINIDEENVLGQESSTSLPSPAYLSGIIGIVKLGDHLYAADHRQDCIWMMDEHGRWTRKIGRKGDGPGEFEILLGITRNSRYVYSTDLGNARINIYDHQFNLNTSLDIVFPGTQTEIAATDSLLFLPAGFASDKLIQVHKASPDFKKVTSILPRIIPLGMEPRGYNIYHIDANDNGQMVFGYLGLPYLFIYDKDLEHIHTLFLQSASHKDLENPPIEPVEAKPGDEFRLVSLFGGTSLMEDGSILVWKGANLYWIDYDNKNYYLKQVMHFTYEVPQQTGDNTRSIHITKMLTDQNTLYISSRFEPYIFRIPVE